MSNSYQDFYRYSIEDPNSFWGEQAKLIDWHKLLAEFWIAANHLSPDGLSTGKPIFAVTR